MSRLSRGVVESESPDTEEEENEEEETSLAHEIPDKWGEIMTTDKDLQRKFKRRLSEAREAFSSNKEKEVVSQLSKDMNSPKSQAFDDVRDRLQKIMDTHPRFIEDLTYLLQPLSELDPDSLTPEEEETQAFINEKKRKGP